MANDASYLDANFLILIPKGDDLMAMLFGIH